MSNVDKLSVESEQPVRLCNYVDVYKSDVINPSDNSMMATARSDEISRFHLEAGDTVLTKDSEDPTDIGISAYVSSSANDFVCGYHLAIARPYEGTHPRYLTWATRSRPVLDHFTNNSNGISRYGLSTNGLMSTPIPFPDFEDQRRIAEFLDDRVARIDRIIAARRQQVALYEGMRRRQLSDLLVTPSDGWTKGPLRRFMISEDYRRVPLSAEERANQQGTFPYYGASGVIDYVDDLLFSEPRVLLSEDGANLLMRSTPISFVAKGNYWVNNHAHVLRPLDEAYDFWAARIEAMDIDSWISGSAQPKLTIEAAMSLPVSAPQNLDARIDLGALQDPGCSRGLNPPVSRRLRS
ncbi:MAG: restriction endonuclease subunit S, partial [Cutibacterium granulosum]|uniref:restriction endonuclease subunit S n=1 Tax=Cutibacterium granulosum TaxID=33011 RepID=UPI002B22355E